jgi:hypothetical protein
LKTQILIRKAPAKLFQSVKEDDLVKIRESRHSCESSPAFGGMDSRFRGNDEKWTKSTFYESVKEKRGENV